MDDYRRLSNNDQYVDQYYLMELLDLYGVIASDEQTEAMVKNLESRGVNFSRQLQFRQRTAGK